VERVVVQLVAAAEEVVEELAVALQVAEDQRLGEVRLVLEMVEEAALGNATGGDQLVDRGRREALGEHRPLGEVEEPVAGRAPLSDRDVEHGKPYQGSGKPAVTGVTGRGLTRLNRLIQM
jgi:hypothetical protein